ncbi:hypothetical protein MMC10_009927 [Thelotrema lepadinum]|nr:hypothetical protein [Thelotrema lepadinum]
MSATQQNTTQLPEWETPNNGVTKEAPYGKTTSSSRFQLRPLLDRHMPPHKRYLGLRRRLFLLVLACIIIALLALIVGLAVGLTLRNKASTQFIPLPSDTRSFTGDLTYYGPGLGACGVTSSDTDDIVSVSHLLFDSESTGSNPNANPLCGLKIRAERLDESVNAQRSVDLTVVDRCVGCQATDLDVSPGAFQQLADMSLGRVTVTWAWLDPTPTP